jgi:hypothetical protein
LCILFVNVRTKENSDPLAQRGNSLILRPMRGAILPLCLLQALFLAVGVSQPTVLSAKKWRKCFLQNYERK